MAIRSVKQLQNKMERDLNWRKREVTTLHFIIQRSQGDEKQTLYRAAITLFYSHWEGHIKRCAICYLEYLNNLKLKCNQVTDNLVQINMGAHVGHNVCANRIKDQAKIFSYFSNLNETIFKVNPIKTIDTESNLKYDVLSKILQQLGLSSDP